MWLSYERKCQPGLNPYSVKKFANLNTYREKSIGGALVFLHRMVKLNYEMGSCGGASWLVVKNNRETAASQRGEVGRKLPFECKGAES